MVVSAAIILKEALEEAEEKRERQGDAGLDDDDRGIYGMEWPGIFWVRGKTDAMRVVVLLPENFMQTYKKWSGWRRWGGAQL